MRIDYARVSTADRNPDLQEDALQKQGARRPSVMLGAGLSIAAKVLRPPHSFHVLGRLILDRKATAFRRAFQTDLLRERIDDLVRGRTFVVARC
jgi:hypothetical protein